MPAPAAIRGNSRQNIARSKMADGSSGDCIDPKQNTVLTFPDIDPGRDHIKKCSEKTVNVPKVNFSSYEQLTPSETSVKSEACGVVADRISSDDAGAQTSLADNSEDRKNRRFDRYDSSESSDSGVAVLSPTESSGCSGSDSTEPGSPESFDASDEARMPPWAAEPAPAARRPPPRPHPPPHPPRTIHRRITEFFNHKMKPHAVKRDASNCHAVDDPKKKCPKNGTSTTHELDKYISYLSQTLSPRVMIDIGKQGAQKSGNDKGTDPKGHMNMNGLIDYSRPKEKQEKMQSVVNCLKEKSDLKDKHSTLTRLLERKHGLETKTSPDPSANRVVNAKPTMDSKRKMPVVASELIGMRIAQTAKPDSTKFDVVSSTTKLDNKINGVTCGSNNISLNPIAPKLAPPKRDTQRKNAQPVKRTNRKSSACIANSKNLTWSKANNLKQVQLQQQNCAAIKNLTGVTAEPISATKVNTPNGVRQVPVAVNGNISNMNVPVTNLQNCHQINLQQQCNGAVTSTHLPSFVAVPQNVMLTTLRIPQNGLSAQAVNQHNNMNAFARQNLNVTTSPTKINGQFMFPLVQNLNGTVVQIPNLMAKVPNFVVPQSPQMSQRQDHLQNQQAQILINGTLLKLSNAMASPYANVNKPMPSATQPIPMNKTVNGIPTVGIQAVQSKQNYTVNLSHPMLVTQPGFIVTSVQNMNVKETWSSTGTNMTSIQNSTCTSTILHHQPPIMNHFAAQPMHTSSIPIAPVKPPDNPIQGTDPPSSTVKEPEIDLTTKCHIPWLTKTVNNNNVTLDPSKTARPFAQVSNLTEKFCQFEPAKKMEPETKTFDKLREKTSEEIRRVEEVARREETIFTQITVLKDVSSNVQNTMLETNFSSARTESSESGIGTDKSIDSPSDSQASKECDEDSSLSLSISVCSMDVQSQKSPILKQPKTLRFPPKNPGKSNDQRTTSTDTTSSVTLCLWEDCSQEFENDTDLLEHLQAIHVETQVGQQNYVCQWKQCKVKGKPSCSRLWLERHALSHGGNKPYKCIVDGCGRRFSTQILLERHVNHHFNEQSPNAGSSKKATDSAPKLIRRNGKKLRYRRQPWSARMFDFFDASTMEGLAYRLGRSTAWRLGARCPLREPAGAHSLTLHAAVAAARYNPARACREALVTYYPPYILADEWIPERDFKRIRRVEISQLSAEAKVLLYDQFCSSYRKSSPPPKEDKPEKQEKARAAPPRCASSRLLNNLLAKQKEVAEVAEECPASALPVVYKEEERAEVSGAKKRKMGRRHGGNAFWPCGR